MPEPDDFVVTPYEVRGHIDYARLRELFGTQELSAELLAKFHHLTGGDLHPLLTRGVYYSHRDLAPVLDGFAHGKPFFLYSGRGPSGPLHTSHLVFDARSIAALYPLAVRVARKVPYSTVKAVFGFEPSTNIGLVFYTALQ